MDRNVTLLLAPFRPHRDASRSLSCQLEGLRLHQIAGRPTKAQLTLVFGKAGYLLTWPKRTERFGIRPEDFQAALAKGVLAVPLTPVTKPTVEKTKGVLGKLNSASGSSGPMNGNNGHPD